MNRIRMIAVAGAMAVVLGSSVPALAATPGSHQSEWHRNNYNAGHEVLTCREGAQSWTCHYLSDVPTGDTDGWFSGRNITDSWTCPEWFPGEICDNVTAVYGGVAVYTPDGERSATIRQNYVVTDEGGQPVLRLYWVDRFVCPWYRTFEEALAADFNCVFAS